MKFKRIFIFLVHFCVRALCVLAVFMIVINVSINAGAMPYIYKNIKDIPRTSGLRAVIIPGAAISMDGGLSPIFRDRVDTAIALYAAGRVSKILVSGDNSTVYHNEVNPVRDYLLKKGIPDADIFLDHAGFDTYSTMYRARDIFKVSSVIISTQSFHLPRAIFIARSLGINAYGISADTGHILVKNYMREVFANEKAVLDLLLHRTPKFLGDAIPITGDGRNYP